MTNEQKLELLRYFRTKELIERMNRLEDELETALREEASFKNLNTGYLASYGSDCSEVERLLSELSIRAPETVRIDTVTVPGETREKKMTAQDRTAWLTLLRTQDQGVIAAINRQHSTAFNLDNLRITTEMVKKRLEGVKTVLSLKTAQIEFLTE